MQTMAQVDELRAALTAAGTPAPEIIRQIAAACTGWPYVFGAWGEECTPANRRRRVRDDHPTILSACPALNGSSCSACKWGQGVRMYDCRGFTRWLLQLVGLDITGGGATSQWDTAANWAQRGEIGSLPEVVCCLFRRKDGRMEHTGAYLTGGQVGECSRGVQITALKAGGWTHYAIPRGLYSPEEIPVSPVRRTLRKGAQGDDVREMQTRLAVWGFSPGSADGIFGKNTEAAVKAFQRAQQLTADGICGPATWGALLDEPVTYTVRAEGVTWPQYRQILTICPLAEATKEVVGNAE